MPHRCSVGLARCSSRAGRLDLPERDPARGLHKGPATQLRERPHVGETASSSFFRALELHALAGAMADDHGALGRDSLDEQSTVLAHLRTLDADGEIEV